MPKVTKKTAEQPVEDTTVAVPLEEIEPARRELRRGEKIHIEDIFEVALPVWIKAWPGTPLVMNNLKGKSHIEDIRMRLCGYNTSKKGTVRNPYDEYIGAMYIDEEGRHCLPTHGIKLAICSALQFIPEIPMTMARARRLIKVNIGQELTPLEWEPVANKPPLVFSVAEMRQEGAELKPSKGKRATGIYYTAAVADDMPELREDVVRLMGKTRAPDLRYRPQYRDWSAKIVVSFPPKIITTKSVFNLINIAGKYIGLCEWRPEKGGEWGMFRIDQERTGAVTLE
jgi:hypothetical protein